MRWRAALIILGPAVLLWWVYAAGQVAAPPELCLEANDRERIRTLALSAFDKAFGEKVEQLMDTWIRDTRDQPDRAMVGLDKAIRVYSRARAQALAWNPPSC